MNLYFPFKIGWATLNRKYTLNRVVIKYLNQKNRFKGYEKSLKPLSKENIRSYKDGLNFSVKTFNTKNRNAFNY